MDTAVDNVLMGSGVDGEPECYLFGTENLPLMGAAGVLVLPKRIADESRSCRGAEEDDLLSYGREELAGWGFEREELSGDRLIDAALRESHFSEYVTCSTEGEHIDHAALEQLRELSTEQSTPLRGPSLIQLAYDPKRREECPVCNAEWSGAIRQLGKCEEGATDVKGSPRNGEAAKIPSARRSTIVTGRGKMHSTRCCWAWYQQNMSSMLCSFRFDAQGGMRQISVNPNRVLPPPIMDVWLHWKQKGRGDRADRGGQAMISDRLSKGEPPS